MTSPAPAHLAVGDRVRERDRVGDDVATPRSPRWQQVAAHMAERRYGQVVALTTRRARNGAQLRYAQVLWDRRRQPSEHACFRLERVASGGLD
jgi:hypothetical protein